MRDKAFSSPENSHGKDSVLQAVKDKDCMADIVAINTADDSMLITSMSKRKVIISSTDFAVGFFKFRLKFTQQTGAVLLLIGVYKPAFINLLEEMGYYKRYREGTNNYIFIHVQNGIMQPVTIEQMKARVYAALKMKEDPLKVEWNGASAEFTHGAVMDIFSINYHNIFCAIFCELLPEYKVPELRDTKENAFFLFRNNIVKVSKEGIDLLPYNALKNFCVWRSHILTHDYNYEEANEDNTKYIKFIHNVCNNEIDRINAAYSALGYVLHNYNHSSMGQAVILYDEKPTDLKNPQGRTGKGLFAQGPKQMREVASIDGKFFDENDKFRYQILNDTTQIVFIDDLKPQTPFTTFFSALSDGWTLEKKNEPQLKIPPEKSPKLMFASNSVLGGNGSSDRSRQFILEFSDHYSKKIKNGTETPIIDEHGIFFDRKVWDVHEWNRFFTFMLQCVQCYLIDGLKPYATHNVGVNSLIQRCGEDFADWVQLKNFQLEIEYKTADIFNEYKATYYGENADYSQRSFTNNLGKYAAIKSWKMKPSRSNGVCFFKFSL